MFKLTSLNLNGIRSASRKGLQAWLEKERPDCMCVQELKAQEADVAGQFEELAGLQGHFHFAEKKGYSGVGIYTRHEPSDVIIGFGSGEFDAEGRYVELRFDSPGRKGAPKLSLISCYFPSGSSSPERQEAKFRFLAEFYPHLLGLKAQREFILCGDVNIAHQAIDLKNSGFLPEERAWMSTLLGHDVDVANAAADELNAGAAQPGTALGAGLVDVYRRLQPTAAEEAYTWWSNRGQAWAKNVGWRIDYHLATPTLAALARSEAVYKAERFSDHAPLTVEYQLAL